MVELLLKAIPRANSGFLSIPQSLRLPLWRQFGNKFKATITQNNLSFAIEKPTQPTSLLFKTSFQVRRLFFKSRLFCSAGNSAQLILIKKKLGI
jgi:hypothetical protein